MEPSPGNYPRQKNLGQEFPGIGLSRLVFKKTKQNKKSFLWVGEGAVVRIAIGHHLAASICCQHYFVKERTSEGPEFRSKWSKLWRFCFMSNGLRWSLLICCSALPGFSHLQSRQVWEQMSLPGQRSAGSLMISHNAPITPPPSSHLAYFIIAHCHKKGDIYRVRYLQRPHSRYIVMIVLFYYKLLLLSLTVPHL